MSFRIKMDRFEEEICRYEQMQVQESEILFYGSSFFTHWGYERARKQICEASDGKINVMNHGFGGASVDELLYYYTRMVRPYKVDMILLRCGVNDIYQGLTANETWFLTERLIEWIKTDNPKAKIGLLGIFDVIRATDEQYQSFVEYNAFLKDYAQKEEQVFYIDLNSFFYEDSKNIGTRKNFRKVFLEDGLHLTDGAYAEMANYLTEKLLEIAL